MIYPPLLWCKSKRPFAFVNPAPALTTEGWNATALGGFRKRWSSWLFTGHAPMIGGVWLVQGSLGPADE